MEAWRCYKSSTTYPGWNILISLPVSVPLSILTICINTHTSAHTHRHTHTPGFPSLLQCYPQLQAQGWKEYQPPRAEKRGDVHIWHIHLGNYSLWLGEKRNLLGSQKKSSIPMFKKKKQKHLSLSLFLKFTIVGRWKSLLTGCSM